MIFGCGSQTAGVWGCRGVEVLEVLEGAEVLEDVEVLEGVEGVVAVGRQILRFDKKRRPEGVKKMNFAGRKCKNRLSRLELSRRTK